MKNLILFVFLIPAIMFAKGHLTAYENPFSVAYGGSGNNLYGDYTSIASSVECVDDGDGGCNNTYTGYLFSATTRYKNSVSVATIPLNSSSETLQLPSEINGADIVYAGLYWQGHIAGTDAANYSTGIAGRDSVILRDPSSTLHTITASKVWYHDFWGDGTGSDGGYRSFYQGYADVTNILQASYDKTRATNTITVGNIKANAGHDNYQYLWADSTYEGNGFAFGYWGNWNLVVVYKYPDVATMSPQPKAKNITIFQGFDALIPITDGVPKSIDLDLSGFLTPLSIPAGESISAKLLFYGSGGEKKLAYDQLRIQDKKTTNYANLSNATNPVNNAFNGSISNFGIPVDSSITYYPGLDSDEYDVSSYMDVGQSSTSLSLSAYFTGGSGDQFFPGMIAFSTDVYEPEFCYDYAYKQNGIYFTEDNNGTVDPKLSTDRLISGAAIGEPIEITIYLRSLVETQVSISDLNVSVLDMNTSQVTYIRNTTQLAPVGSITPNPISDSSLTVDDANIKGIPVGTVNSNQYFYLYYQVDPKSTKLDMPIDINVSYNVVVDASSPLTYTHKVGASHKIQMCSSDNFTYVPAKGIFNVVHNNFYNLDTGGTNKYYNLPTQVTNREGNFKVISLDPANLDSLKGISTVAAVEMIDASAFHDTNASCSELESSISPRVWVTFDNNVTSASFDKDALASAISDVRTTLAHTYDFYSTARENAAFRVTYNVTNDGNESLIDTTRSGDKWIINNFTQLVQDIGTCKQYVDAPAGASSQTTHTNQVSVACGNAGNVGISAHLLQACMECLYGYNTKVVCSRDNFSIRPEALKLQLNDQSQTNPATKSAITNDGNIKNISAGYNYDLNITATNFINDNASYGYTKSFGYSTDDNISYLWEPRSGVVTTGCNDDSNKSITLRFLNGNADLNSSIDQVGDYRLHAIDTSWTKVDYDPTLMAHHTGDYFLSNTVPDCVKGTSAVQAVNSATLNGCNISSDHTNTNISTVYRDYNVTFHPYKFDLRALTVSVGLTNDTTFDTNTFIYMSDINVSADENMSVHMNGLINATGENNVTVSNYVDNCFAKPVNITLTKTNYTTTTTGYGYIYHDYNSTGDENSTFSADINNTAGPLALDTTHFLKDMVGSINTILNLNFDRNLSIPVNPQTITFNNYTIDCQDPANDCTFLADLTTKTTQGDLAKDNNLTDLNKTVKHYYGRTHAPRYRYPSDVGEALIYYEVYCDSAGDPSLLPDGVTTAESIDSIDWYNNPNHVIARDGNVSSVVESRGRTNVTLTNFTEGTPSTAELTYDIPGTTPNSYPYKTTMQDAANGWLIYNKYNYAATVNEFEVEFYNSGSNWTGVHETDTTTDSNASDTTSKRIFW